jgi:CubicO group peptidase (beta-lactamase class C family)
MLLADGRWHGRAIVPEAWLAESTAPASHDIPTCGYLWWIQRSGSWHRVTRSNLDTLKTAGFAATWKLRALTGIPFPRATLLWKAMLVLLRPAEQQALWQHSQEGRSPFETTHGRVIGYSANGLLGQYLAVYPQKRVLAVRMRRRAAGESALASVQNSYGSFFEELELLLRASVPLAAIRAE